MLPYNNKDITSIFNYSKQLVNKCLRDFAPDADEHKGKGGLGQLVEELFFKYDINSRQEADFAFVNAELKCTQSSHLVQYAQHLTSKEYVFNSEMLIFEYALCKHSSEQKVRLSSTSQPSSIRW